MLSRGGAFGGLVGSSNAQWAVQRARPSLSDSKVLNTIADMERLALASLTRAERETLIGLLKKFGYKAAAASGQSKEQDNV